jgi:hypothetical protein
MHTQLETMGALDVTWVRCANGPDVRAFNTWQRDCLHPCFAVTPWTKKHSSHTHQMQLGHLTPKHKPAASAEDEYVDSEGRHTIQTVRLMHILYASVVCVACAPTSTDAQSTLLLERGRKGGSGVGNVW